MVSYPHKARERTMKVEEVLLRVASGESTFWQAVRVLNRSARHVRRLMQRYRQRGFPALLDGRTGRPSAKRMPWAVAEQVLLRLHGPRAAKQGSPLRLVTHHSPPPRGIISAHEKTLRSSP